MTEVNLTDRYPGLSGFEERLTTANEAVSVIKAGNQVFIGTACATPRKLVAALENTVLQQLHCDFFLDTGEFCFSTTPPPS